MDRYKFIEKYIRPNLGKDVVIGFSDVDRLVDSRKDFQRIEEIKHEERGIRITLEDGVEFGIEDISFRNQIVKTSKTFELNEETLKYISKNEVVNYLLDFQKKSTFAEELSEEDNKTIFEMVKLMQRIEFKVEEL